MIKNNPIAVLLILLVATVAAISILDAANGPIKVGTKVIPVAAAKPAVSPSTPLIQESTPMAPAPAAKSPLTGEHIAWQVVSNAGGTAVSSAIHLSSTLGQTAVGKIASSSNHANIGFWQSFACCTKPGDANNDGNVNVGDAVFLINFIFKSGVAPSCKAQGDSNADCKLNVGDVVYLINFVFKHGAAPLCGCAI